MEVINIIREIQDNSDDIKEESILIFVNHLTSCRKTGNDVFVVLDNPIAYMIQFKDNDETERFMKVLKGYEELNYTFYAIKIIPYAVILPKSQMPWP